MSDTIWMIKVHESYDGEVISDIYDKYGWFSSESDALDFMRDNDLQTEDEAREEWKRTSAKLVAETHAWKRIWNTSARRRLEAGVRWTRRARSTHSRVRIQRGVPRCNP